MTDTISALISNSAQSGGSQVAQATSDSKSASGRAKISADFNNFLTLLTTQLTHQDPLSPLDTHQFTNQLVQFAAVEQQIQQSENLEKLVTLMEGSKATTSEGIGYLGKTVLHSNSNRFFLQEEGDAKLQYVLPPEVNNARFEIKNADGKIVYSDNFAALAIVDKGGNFRLEESGGKTLTYSLPQGSAQGLAVIYDSKGRLVHQETVGNHGVFVWDGNNSQQGERAEQGDYTFQVKALSNDGNAKQGEIIWHGFTNEQERAPSGKYTFHLKHDPLLEGTNAEPIKYISSARVTGIKADTTDGLLLMLDNGLQIKSDKALAVYN